MQHIREESSPLHLPRRLPGPKLILGALAAVLEAQRAASVAHGEADHEGGHKAWVAAGRVAVGLEEAACSRGRERNRCGAKARTSKACSMPPCPMPDSAAVQQAAGRPARQHSQGEPTGAVDVEGVQPGGQRPCRGSSTRPTAASTLLRWAASKCWV